MEPFRLLILGDINQDDTATQRGQQASTNLLSNTHLQHFLRATDFSVVNLSTPVTREREGFATTLKELGVGAVNLASGYAFHRSPDQVESTIQTLSDLGVDWFGAGYTFADAQAPYNIELPELLGGGQIHLHGMLQYSQRLDKSTGVFAAEEAPGSSPLRASSAPQSRHDTTSEDSFQVALPYWGMPGRWRSHEQFALAHRLLKKDFDLIVGNGSPHLQEILRKQRRWVIYGQGEGIPGKSRTSERSEDYMGAPPFSLWAILEVHQQSSCRKVTLKLYPVSTGGIAPRDRLRPVSLEGFQRVKTTFASQSTRPWRFENSAKGTGQDNLGYYIALDLGEWLPRQRPSRLDSRSGPHDPGDWPLRSPGVTVEDKVLGVAKHLGATILAVGAESGGGTAQWLKYDTAVIEAGDKRLLAYRYNAHESALGAEIINDKVLTAEVLESAGVPTPRTILVKSVEEAIQAAKEIGLPVVIKPRRGVQSKGVSTGIFSDDEVREAFFFARESGTQIIVQPHIHMAEELRVMASPERAVAVNGRLFPHIIGDGLSTIHQLIEDKNLQRTLNPSLYGRAIPVDTLTRRQLSREGLNLSSVPQLGEAVTVRNVAGLSVGGDTNQVLEETDALVKNVASAAIAAIPSLGWGGVDVLIEKDTGKPYVIEINSRAAYGAALFPAYGQPRDIGKEIWKLRHADTVDVTDRVPHISPIIAEPTPIVLKAMTRGPSRFPFWRLLLDSLQRQNFKIDRKTPRVWHIATPGDSKVWMTRNGLSAVDREVVRSSVQRHWIVSLILKSENIPRTNSRLVTSIRQLESFTRQGKSPLMAMSRSSSWGGATVHTCTVEEAQSRLSKQGAVWVQSLPSGPRVRVVASRDQSWAVVVDAELKHLEDSAIESASMVAIQAVRAVPELRWAAVDMVMLRRRKRGSGLFAFVEGMTLEPVFSKHDRLIAGDFDSFCRWLIHSADAPTVVRSPDL